MRVVPPVLQDSPRALIVALFIAGLVVTFVALAMGGTLGELSKQQPERFKDGQGWLPILWTAFGIGFALILAAMAMFVWGMLQGLTAK